MLRIDEEINVFVFAQQQCTEEAEGSECLAHEPGDAENVALTRKWCPSGYTPNSSKDTWPAGSLWLELAHLVCLYKAWISAEILLLFFYL